MISIEELKNKLRTDYAYYIRPLVIKDKCDLCGNDKELEVHHTIQFSELFYETLKELNLEVINIKHRLGKVFIKLKEYENEIEEKKGLS